MCEKTFKLHFIMEVDALDKSFEIFFNRKKAPLLPRVGDTFLINDLKFYVDEIIIPVSMDNFTVRLKIDSLLSNETIDSLKKQGWVNVE